MSAGERQRKERRSQERAGAKRFRSSGFAGRRIARNSAFVAWLEAIAVGFSCTKLGCSQASSKVVQAPLPAGAPAVGHRVLAWLKDDD
jgi:hypothetical protein